MAAIVSPTFRVREMKIEDGNPYDIDLEWVTPQGEENKQTIFAKNSSMLLRLNSLELLFRNGSLLCIEAVVGFRCLF